MKTIIKRKNKQGGAAMLVVVIFFLFISLAIISGLVLPTVREFRNTSMDLRSKQSFFLAESGGEDVAYRFLKNKTVGDSETIMLDSNSATTTVNTLVGNIKEIVSLGNVSNYERQTSLKIRAGAGVVFKYGTQAGQGGFVFRNNSYVIGNLYSNGPILGSNGAYITGDAYAAGSSGLISNMRVGYGGTGDARSHTVTGSTVTGNLYCQTGSSNNKSCDTSQADPLPQDLPITEENITKWKDDATNGGITNGNVTISTPTTMGPRKIIGNLIINNTLTLTDTIYVTGDITLNAISGNPTPPTIELDSTYGATSGIIISDGLIAINNNVVFQDSGTTGSYIMLLSTSSCDESISSSPCNGRNAIEVNNNSDISIVNSQNGTVYFANNASVKESVGEKIILKQNVGISYGSGVINVGFTSGPGGSWDIESWVESQ